MITVTYDSEVNATYIKLNDTKIRSTQSLDENCHVDTNYNSQLVGVEYFGNPGELRRALEDDKYHELWTDLFEFVRDF